MKTPILLPMRVMTLYEATMRFQLDPVQVARLEIRLAGRERRLADGRIGYYFSDIRGVLTLSKAA